ncbi:uncharacterized protein LOC129947325 [Eupeodes corollae]|uniref:uncharacterized protein LOC129947325 n=1 Tax=Eupeodes corollae TaxID=290404 RepID=UPI00248FF5E9|nr:uncharacterized protein LOC129947325 [Eupeodes corollae]
MFISSPWTFWKIWILMACMFQISLQIPMMSRETNICVERQQAGLICETCELLATCVKMSHGYLTVPVETCDTDKGFYCNVNLGACSNVTGPCHPFGYEGNFVCTSQGVFPDPYDCQKYHMCYVAGTTLVSANIECGGDKAFNVETGECSLSITDSVCDVMQYECPRVGFSAAWPNNKNLFYICKATTNDETRVLYPTLYRCGANEMFDGLDCVSDDGSYPVTVVKPTKTPSTGSVTSQPSRPDSSECTSAGLQVDPADCRSYYYCSGIRGTKKHTTCPKGTYFNAGLASCTIGSC